MEKRMTGSRDWRKTAVVIAVSVFAVFFLFTVVRSLATQGERADAQRAEQCASDYGYLLQVESFGHSAQASHLWPDFSVDCPSQVDELSAYYAARTEVRSAGNVCSERLDAELLGMLESHGECDGVPLADGYEATPVPAPSTAAAPSADQDWPGGDAFAWSDAGAHSGTVQRVCGPLASVRSDEEGTYLNIGFDYPDRRRFTLIFWNVGAIDPIPVGATVCATGSIIDYDGVAQIHTQPEKIEIWP